MWFRHFNAAVQTTTLLGNKEWRRVTTPDGLDDVVIAASFLPHVVEKRGQARERFANYVVPTLSDPLEVWLTEYPDGSFRRRFVKAFEDVDTTETLVIARENKDGSLLYNFIRTDREGYADSQRTGFLLYRRSDR